MWYNWVACTYKIDVLMIAYVNHKKRKKHENKTNRELQNLNPNTTAPLIIGRIECLMIGRIELLGGVGFNLI